MAASSSVKDQHDSVGTPATHQVRGFHSADADFLNYDSTADKQQQPLPPTLSITPTSSGQEMESKSSTRPKSHTMPQHKSNSVRSLGRRLLHRGSNVSSNQDHVSTGAASSQPQHHPHALSSPSTRSDHNADLLTWRPQRSSFFRRSSLVRAPPNLHKMTEYFRDCVAPNNRIHIRLYIQGFKEIVKFLCALGNLLAFASRDIEAKISRMDELLASEHKRHYLFLDDLLAFELEKGIVNSEGIELLKTKSGRRYGTRIMFRLHQSLAFLVLFFTNCAEQPNSKMQKIVNDAYKASISKNHSWLIRKTATLAFHVLPSRSTLISRIGPNYTEEMAMKQFREIIDATTLAYETTQNLFDQHMSVARHEPKTPTDNQSEAGASAS